MKKRALSCFGCFALAALLHFAPGCQGSGTGMAGKQDTRTALEYFKDEQARTNTPCGKVRVGTAQQRGVQIEFQTEDGRHWRVAFEKRDDGTYRYGTPVAVEVKGP